MNKWLTGKGTTRSKWGSNTCFEKKQKKERPMEKFTKSWHGIILPMEKFTKNRTNLKELSILPTHLSLRLLQNPSQIHIVKRIRSRTCSKLGSKTCFEEKKGRNQWKNTQKKLTLHASNYQWKNRTNSKGLSILPTPLENS